MPKATNTRKLMKFVYMTVLPLALSAGFAEARGAGAGFQAAPQDTGRAGRAYSPKALPAMPAHMGDEIVAERELIRVQASEAHGMLDDLRTQLVAQPDAKLSIRWRLTRPAGIK